MKPITLVSVVCLVCLLWLTTPQGELLAQNDALPESSETTVLLTIRPAGLEDGSRFMGSAEPGESIEFTAVIENWGDQPVEVRIFASDVLPAINGGLSIAPSDSERTGKTLWLDFPTEEITLQPKESVERPLVVNVPADTPPGQYVNAVAIETVNPVQEGAVFRQFFRKVASVYVTVPGEPVSDISIGEPEVRVVDGQAALLIPIENVGNVGARLVADVEIDSEGGSRILSTSSPLGVIYMGQSTYFVIPLPTVPDSDHLLVSYSFADTESDLVKSGENVAVEVPEDESVAVSPISFEDVSIQPNSEPIIFTDVSVTIASAQRSYSSTKLTMSVYLDGVFVEDIVLAENLNVTVGSPAVISQRYLPATNWESGTYTFSLKLESMDGGSISLLLEEEDVATLEVP